MGMNTLVNSKTWLFRTLVTAAVIGVTVFVVLLALGVVGAKERPNEPAAPMTVEEAMEMIREFEEADLPDLEPWPHSGDETSPMLRFRSDGATYEVNSETGRLAFAVYGDQETGPDVNVTLEEALSTATILAGKVHPDFKDLTLTKSELRDHGTYKVYGFQWFKMVVGARTPSFVVVDINPATGEVIMFVTKDVEIQSFAPPSITATEAQEIAVAAFEERTGRGTTVSEAELIITDQIDENRHLVWQVTVTETTESHELCNAVWFYIDARTGEILAAYHSA